LVRGEFYPSWHTLDDEHQLYTLDDESGEPAARGSLARGVGIRRHREASIAFELVAAATLDIAARQQLATLTEVAQGPGAASRILTDAIKVSDQVVDKLLPLHAATRNGTESVLLSAHYHRVFLRNMLRAQYTYSRALYLRTAEPKLTLYTIAMFFDAAVCLRAARRSLPLACTKFIDAMALHRYAVGVLVLANALYARHKNLDDSCALIGPIEYANERDAQLDAVPHVELLEAVVIVRLATSLMPETSLTTNVMSSYVSRAKTLYSVVLSDAQTRRFTVAPTDVDLEEMAAWRERVMAVRSAVRVIVCRDKSFERPHIFCEHRAPRSRTIDLDSSRIYQICLPS
jgi:hypothetical protein